MTQQFNSSDYTAQFDPQDIEQNKLISAVAYLSVLFFLPLIAAPQSAFGRFHANQALLILLLGAVAGIVAIVPVLGWIAALVASVFSVVCFVLGLINALQGRAKELPLIGKIRIIH